MRRRPARGFEGLESVIDENPKRTRSWLVWVAAGAGAGLLIAVSVAVLYFTVWTVGFTLDGRQFRMRSTTTVADLFSQGLVSRKPGNLISVKSHRILKAGGGGRPYVSAIADPLAMDSRVLNGAVLVSSNGTDVVEPTRVETETIPVVTQYIGMGPNESVVQTGSPGVREVTVGLLSDEIAHGKALVREIDRVVTRQGVSTGGAKVVALRFDDGPWPGSTLAILAILKKYGVKATFFEIGEQVRHRPALSRAVVQAGMELDNHSETHPLPFQKLSNSAVVYQIKNAEKDIEQATGTTPRFFGPPGGGTPPGMYAVLSELHMDWVQWDVDTQDWMRPGSRAIISKVMRHVTPGAVILMHDGGGDRSQTVAALPTIIRDLKAAGYSFVTVSQLHHVPHTMG